MKSNSEVLNQIRDTASAEYQSRVGAVAAGETGADVFQVLSDYPTSKNEFINALTNKVVKSVFYSKVFSNPLQMLHRGMLPYGTGVEQIFVEMANKKGFGEHFSGGSDTADLIGKEEGRVVVDYIAKNFAYKYKVSISDAQLRGAFLSATGLGELVSQLTNSLISGAYFDEYSDMKQILVALAEGKQLVAQANGLYAPTALTTETAKAPMKTIAIGDASADARKLAEAIRSTAGRLRFPSTVYNMAGVKTFSEKEDLVFLTTPEMVAKLDVNVIAQAFNVSAAEATVRVIEVDELPSKFASSIGGAAVTKNCYGVLVDRDFLQSYDTVMETRTFENGDKLMTNMFLHKQGIMSACLFANAVAFVQA